MIIREFLSSFQPTALFHLIDYYLLSAMRKPQEVNEVHEFQARVDRFGRIFCAPFPRNESQNEVMWREANGRDSHVAFSFMLAGQPTRRGSARARSRLLLFLRNAPYKIVLHHFPHFSHEKPLFPFSLANAFSYALV
jgi:hypothetical protein